MINPLRAPCYSVISTLTGGNSRVIRVRHGAYVVSDSLTSIENVDLSPVRKKKHVSQTHVS